MKKKIKILLCLVILLIMLSPIRINASSQDSSRGIVVTDYIDIVSEGIENFDNINYIDNQNYFRNGPSHAASLSNDVWGGACTTVAMQLLIGYHNYYSDRRLIPKCDEENELFLSGSYGRIEGHPLISTVGGDYIGTESLLYKKLLGDPEDFYIPIIDQYVGFVANRAMNYIEEYADVIEDSVNISSYPYYSKFVAKEDIDNNFPIILGKFPYENTALDLHVVVAYGYAEYNGRFGYIVHYGHEDKEYVWVPESYFHFMIRMSIDHMHNFKYSHNITKNVYVELKCEICGANTPDKLYQIDEANSKIIGLNYDIYGSIYIPIAIYGNTIFTIENSAFKNCNNLTSVSISDTITHIGNSAFEGCTSLSTVNFLGTITSIGNNCFQGCTSLQDVSFSYSVASIGDLAFANCTSLKEIEIPGTEISIGDNVFEGCTALQTVNFSTSITSIGDNAFEDCISLEEINIPNSVISIGDYAFKNCSSLKTVTINRDNIDITELGMNAFLGCSSLNTINVPGNRILEYMNATNWKNHKLKIKSTTVFEEVNINCLSDEELTIAINPSENGILKINIECANSYEITASSDYYIIFKLYDSNMQEINVSPTMSSTECSGVFSSAFPSGVYYISVKYTSGTISGEALVNVKFNDGTNNYFEYGLNDALEHLHNYDNQLKNSSVYHNNQGAGLYKVSISGDLQSYQNVLTIYDNSNKVEPMKRIETSLYELDAITSMASNNLVVLFQNYTSYYIDIIVPSGTYSSLTLIIEKVEETYEIDLVNGSQTIYNIMNSETLVGDHFVVLEIVEASTISVIYDYTGTQDEFIYFVLFKEVYNNNELKYEMQLVFPEMMVTYGESLEWRSTITAGKHYIGYFNKFNPNSTISISITG